MVSKIDLSFRVNCFHEAQCPHPATGSVFLEWPTPHLKTVRVWPVLTLNPSLQVIRYDSGPSDQKRHPYQTQVLCALTDFFFFNLERLLLAVDSNLTIYRSPKAAEEQPAWSLGVSGQSIITKPRARFQ